MSPDERAAGTRKGSLQAAFRSLRLVWKVNGLFLLILVLVLGISAYASNLAYEKAELSAARELSLETSDRILQRIRRIMMEGPPHELQGVVGQMASENPIYRDVRLLDHGGAVLSSQLPPETQAIDSTSWPCTVCHEPGPAPGGTPGCPTCKVLGESEGARYLSVAMPIYAEAGCVGGGCHDASADSTVLGVLQSDYSLARMDSLIAQRNRQTIWAILISIILGSAATWWMTERLIGRRIQALREGALRVAQHDFSFRFGDTTGDGLGEFVGVFDDMTEELSSTLLELSSAREHLQAIVENSADIIITVDPAGLITTFNPGAEQILGYQREEVVGRRIEMLFQDPRDRDKAISELDHTDHVVNYITRFVTKNGKIRNVLLTLSRLRSPDGEPIGTLGVSKDITRELRLQQRLLRSERMAALGQTITGIQHSIKNMLNAMKGGSYMVKLGLTRDDKAMLMEGWEMVQQGIENMTQMSRSMLDFARTQKLRIKPTDLVGFLEKIHGQSKSKFKDEGVELVLESAEELPPVEVDAEMIRSVVMDLLSNALDTCSWKVYPANERPRVTLGISSSADPAYVDLVVKDNGEGMPAEVKERIFTPFFSTKDKAGTGMGLAVVSRIVKSHDGRITVESEPKEGTTFTVTLPINGPSLREEDSDAEESTGGR